MSGESFVGPLTCCFCGQVIRQQSEYLEASIAAPAMPPEQVSSHRLGMHPQCLLDRLTDEHRASVDPLV